MAKRLALAGLIAAMGLAGAGCGRRVAVEMPPESPSSYTEHIAYNTDTRSLEFFQGTDDGNILKIQKGGVTRIYWDREPGVGKLEYFISEGNEEVYMPNPDQAYWRHYQHAIRQMERHVERGSYHATR